MKTSLLVLAVATYVSAEADAQIPLALMPGFRFSPVSPPLVYHRSPVHFYKAEQIEESDEKMEERLRIAQHEGADRPMPGPKVSSKEAPTPYKKDGFTSKIVAQPFGFSEESDEKIECRNNEGSLVPCARQLLPKLHPELQMLYPDNFIQKDGSISRVVAQPKGVWRGYAHSLLCNTPGSNTEKADEIVDRLYEADEDSNWIVFVSDNDEGSAFSKRTGEKVWHDDTCGKAMYVWTREDSLFAGTSCSDDDERRMTTLMRSAVSGGGDNAAVRDRLKTDIDNFGYDFHFMRVASDTGNWRQRVRIYPSCAMSLNSNGYMIYVYMKSYEGRPF